MTRGHASAVAGYVLWGLFPLYWKVIEDVPAFEILAHRIIWSAAVLGVILVARRDWGWLDVVRHDRRVAGSFGLTALLLATNWVVYVWANNNGHMVEASLGYFVNPLVSVVLGLLILRERLRRGQVLAVLVAAMGVGYLVVNAQGALWVSLTLAFSFGIYGLLRKTAKLGSFRGLSLEMTRLFLPALAFVVILGARDTSSFAAGDPVATWFLVGGGAVTVVPLLLFAYGARRVTLVTLGLLQYFAPTLQFLIGVLVFHEPFPIERAVGFAIIWIALAIYSLDGVRAHRRSALVAPGDVA